MLSTVITVCWIEIAALIGGAVLILASPSSSDAAGRALGQGYVVILVTAVLLFFVLPAMLLARGGHVPWLAVTLAGIAAIPALGLAIGSVVSLAEYVSKRMKRR